MIILIRIIIWNWLTISLKKGQAFVLNMYLLTCYYYNDVYWVVPTSLLSNIIAIMYSFIYFSQYAYSVSCLIIVSRKYIVPITCVLNCYLLMVYARAKNKYDKVISVGLRAYWSVTMMRGNAFWINICLHYLINSFGYYLSIA